MDELAAHNLLLRGSSALARAEHAGMRVDVDYCERKRAHLARRIARTERKLNETEFAARWHKEFPNKANMGSNAQLGHMLYKVWGIDPPKLTKKSEQGSTDEETLNQIDLPELKHVLELRRLRKIRDTYLENFVCEQVDGFIHPFLNLHTTRTYRGSSDSPNLQNIPNRDEEAKRITRRALLPREGHQLLEVDFGGIEVAVAACYHQDPTMLAYIRDPANDMHGDLAHQIFMLDDYDSEIARKGFKGVPTFKTLRDATKNSFTFPQFYGDYYGNCALNFIRWTGLSPSGRWKRGRGFEMPDGRKLSDHMIDNGIASYKNFEEHLKAVEDDFWNRRFRVYGQWRRDWYNDYLVRGYVDMLTGFRCRGLMGRNEVINYPIQGAAFHCLLWTLIRVDEIAQEEEWDSRIVNQIHDALLLDVHPDELEHVARTIHYVATVELPAEWTWIVVPLEVEAKLCPVDHSWADERPFELLMAA